MLTSWLNQWERIDFQTVLRARAETYHKREECRGIDRAREAELKAVNLPVNRQIVERFPGIGQSRFLGSRLSRKADAKIVQLHQFCF